VLKKAKKLQKELVEIRRKLHQIPEVGFALENTVDTVKEYLKKFGYEPKKCGRAGLIATVGKGEPILLLRADMDALPITEDTGLDFAGKNGNMHACGHDLHTAMLLGAARLLKEEESRLKGEITLVFQPAEEILEGAKDMLKNGLLKTPPKYGALMAHVTTATDMPTGSIVLSKGEYLSPSADYFEIFVQGKGCHGAMPSQGVDAISVAARIVLGLEELTAREITLSERLVLTIGQLSGGNAPNAIADSAVLKGTFRCYGESLRERIKGRVEEIAKSIAKGYRASARVAFTHGCPAFKNNQKLVDGVQKCAVSLLGDERVIITDEGGGGSEDFACISQKVPATMVVLAAGQKGQGYDYPLHHPKACFDENALCVGAALFAEVALNFLAFSDGM